MKMELLINDFRDMLERGEVYDLVQLASEFPDELYEDLLKNFIAMEFDFYRTKGWTYNHDREEQFPELSEFIAALFHESARGVKLKDLEDNGSRQRHIVSCEYGVTRWAFAEGGQGALYRAIDNGLGKRKIAVKVLKNSIHAERFQAEAEITAKLDHPGIAPVYSYSFDGKNEDVSGKLVDGRPFYAMRLINGLPLSDRIADFHNQNANKKKNLRENPDFVRLIESLISSCHTIAYAHSVGVLHCDIKPQNIMCGQFGATIVLDWGSATSGPSRENEGNEKRIQCPESTNDSLYTPAYASPEQKNGLKIDERADVFSLGATLYQIIAGFTMIDTDDFESRHESDIIGNVRTMNPCCSKALNSICEKALKVDPNDRYSGPEALAQDLSHWLRGEEVSAKPDNLIDKTFRLANQHRLVTGIGLLSFGLILFGVLAWNSQRIKEERLRSSRDSGFTLIEDICAPLENGELQNPEELATVARLVRQHCDSQFSSERAIASLDQRLVARLYHLRSLTNYFYHSVDLKDLKDHQIKNQEKFLQNSIDDVSEAINLFESSTSDNYVNERLAESHLFKARLLKLRETRESSDSPESDLKLALESIRESENYFSMIAVEEKSRDEKFDFELKQAELNQLEGEILLREATEADNKNFANEKYRLSAKAFGECIKTLEKVTAQSPQQTKKYSRVGGRGYGYLGDAQLALKEFGTALQSHAKSLQFRQEIVANDNDSSPEHLLQLARGYDNFASTIRNFGIVAKEDVVGPDAKKDSMEFSELEKEQDSKKRCELILSCVRSYAGLNKPQPFCNMDSATSGIADASKQRMHELYLRLSRLGGKDAKREYAGSLSSVAELYFQAANQLEDGNEKTHLLNVASTYAVEARLILTRLRKEEDDRAVKTALAYSEMLVLQINRSLGIPAGDEKVHVLQFLPKLYNKNVTMDDIFVRCVAIKDDPELSTDLKKGIQALASRGYQHHWRFRQHFDEETYETFKRISVDPVSNDAIEISESP